MTVSGEAKASTPAPSTTAATLSPSPRSMRSCDGEKRGYNMDTPLMTAAQTEAAVREAMVRLSKRYTAAVNRALGIRTEKASNFDPTRTHDLDHYVMPMSAGDRRKLGDWFMERYNYLQEIYRQAINDNESIIAGRQMLYDARPRLIDADRDIYGGKV